MDIFIGGVRDRNTALHGDLVAVLINPPAEWKILNSQLDAFLAEQERLEHIVYNESNSNSNVSHSEFASVSPLSNTINVNIAKSHVLEKSNDDKPHHKIESDVVDEEEEIKILSENSLQKKKKKHRRGKKKKNVNQTNQKSFDQELVVVIANPFKCEASVKQKINTSTNVVVVPPDQLYECDLTNDDDESVHSLTLDFHEQHIDTKNFIDNEIKNTHNSEMIASDSTQELCAKKLIFSKEHIQSTKANIFNDLSNKNFEVKAESMKSIKNLSKREFGSVEQIMTFPNWEKFIQKTAVVVRIMERKHSMLAAGILKSLADKNPHIALFSPFDSRIPRIKIQMKDCPKDFLAKPEYYSKVIFLAKLTEWNDPKFALGVLCRVIGRIGDIEAETESLLLENSVDFSDFPDSVMKCIPKLPWTIPDEEKKTRADFRNSVIFTIDPSTARDLDDAVSCLQLQNGNFRVGVHIADVAHFVPLNSELDRIAAERANSVYLVQKVVPMLPRPLCEELCSLNPGEDRLTFSVVWELTPDGKIVGDWYGRSIIRSCVKLSYEDAQRMIDNESPFNLDDFPQVSGNVSLSEISDVVKNLHSIATKLRNRRVSNGALKLNQLRIGFALNLEKNCPIDIFIQEQKDSNRLIEEFMLLANISVAHKISSAFPNLSLLRKHPPPHELQIENTLKFLNLHGIHLDATSSKTLSDSIQRYDGTDSFSMARMQLIVNMCSKPMQYARYFCSGIVTEAKDQHHYALNVPCYTHFTSPIRRYADIVVHRLLASAIDREQTPLPKWTSITIEKIACHCNDKKQASKVVTEASTELFLSLYIQSFGKMIESGIIIGILDRCIDVLLTRLGIIKRCYMEKIPLENFLYIQKENAMFLEWKDEGSNVPKFTQKLTYFDIVTVELHPFENDALKFNAFLIRPKTS